MLIINRIIKVSVHVKKRSESLPGDSPHCLGLLDDIRRYPSAFSTFAA